MRKTDSPTPPAPPPPEPREPKPSPLVKLRRTPTPNRLTPVSPPDTDYDEFRDDNNDPAEQELAAVFANDKDSGKDDDRFDLTSSAPATKSQNRARSSIDFLNNLSKSGKSTPENPPSRSRTPGTLAANKLKMFGNYNLGERAESRGPPSDHDNGGGGDSDLEVVSPLPPEEIPAAPKKPSSSDVLPKKKDGPGKLQFQMKQKTQAKKAVKTGSLNLSKFSKFGKGSAVFKSRDEEDVPPAPSKKAATPTDVKRKQAVELDGNVPSAEEYKMKRRQKSMDVDEADPFDGIPQTTEKQQDDGVKKIDGFQRKPVAELEDVSREEFKIKRRPRSIMDDEEMDGDDVVDPFEGIPQTEGIEGIFKYFQILGQVKERKGKDVIYSH